MERQSYETPKLTSHGRISDLTLGGTFANQDVPFGNAPNTAYPPPGS